MATQAPSIVDTQAWDLILSMPFATANQVLATGSPTSSFSYSGTGLGQSFAFQGSFGAWQIIGGSGQLLTLSIPITTGSLTVTGQGPLTAGNHALDGATVQVTTALSFVAAQQQGDPATLSFAFKPGQLDTGPDAPTSTEAAASGGAGLDPLVAAVLPSVIANCLAANVSDIGFVFAALAPGVSGQILGSTAYMVATPAGGTAGLTVLGAVAGGVEAQSIVPACFEGAAGGTPVAVSQSLLLSAMVLPALAHALEASQYPMAGMIGMGFGPEIHPGASANNVDPAIFSSAMTGAMSGMVSTDQTVALNMLGFSNNLSVSLTAIQLTLTGSTGTLSLTASSSQFSAAMVDISIPITTSVHAAEGFEQAGLTLETGTATVTPASSLGNVGNMMLGGVENEVADRITASLGRCLSGIPAPIEITILNGQALSPVSGYVNGGLFFIGAANPSPPPIA